MENETDDEKIRRMAEKIMADTGVDKVTATAQAWRHVQCYLSGVDLRKMGIEFALKIKEKKNDA